MLIRFKWFSSQRIWHECLDFDHDDHRDDGDDGCDHDDGDGDDNDENGDGDGEKNQGWRSSPRPAISWTSSFSSAIHSVLILT